MARNMATSKILIVFIIYIAFLLDNILLTVVVPIIPDFLYKEEGLNTSLQLLNSTLQTPKSLTLVKLKIEALENENGPIGALLASKALIQLGANPVVGYISSRFGYNIPMVIGTTNLLLAALLFAYGQTFPFLLLARSLHGIASSCIAVSGMSSMADLFQNEVRSKLMGLVLGSVAVGVLLGYPLGGIFYDFIGKTTPFVVVAILISICIVLQVSILDLTSSPQNIQLPANPSLTSWKTLLSDPPISSIAGAIWISTTAMAVLEPCLPLWLMGSMSPPPEKWQLGTVFIPDSLGYFIGTNFTGLFTENFRKWKIGLVAMILVGVCATLVPSAITVSQLIAPHFGLGLGIGILDASLVPLLANLVDSRHGSVYGAVYAIQQTAVALAYSVGPLLGGELVKVIGFPWLMRIIGFINITYCPILLILAKNEDCDKVPLMNSNNYVTYNSDGEPKRIKTSYQRFIEDDE